MKCWRLALSLAVVKSIPGFQPYEVIMIIISCTLLNNGLRVKSNNNAEDLSDITTTSVQYALQCRTHCVSLRLARGRFEKPSSLSAFVHEGGMDYLLGVGSEDMY